MTDDKQCEVCGINECQALAVTSAGDQPFYFAVCPECLATMGHIDDLKIVTKRTG